MNEGRFVGVDWGTSSLRAYLIDKNGQIVEQTGGAHGIANCNGDFEETLMRYVGQWVRDWGIRDIVMSGMITSKHGWVETPYLPIPVSRQTLVDALAHRQTAEGLDLWFAPGLRLDQDSQTVDVIRGEETQVLACMADGPEQQLIVLPGSHSKWILVRGGQIAWFSTFLTGELFAAIAEHTLLRTTLLQSPSEAQLREGIALGWSDSRLLGGLLHKLFTLRVRGLFAPEGGVSRDLLTGLVLGTEIKEATAQLGSPLPPVTVIGRTELARHYILALEVAGIEGRLGPENAAAEGLHQLFSSRYVGKGLR